MFTHPFDFRCPACGRVPADDGWGLCVLCGRMFCADHLVIRKSVATCDQCAPERERREAASGVSASEENRVVSLVRADVEATVGPGHDRPIIEAAARLRLFDHDPAGYLEEVVDQVQQHFHDTFIDTTWPTCPRHPNHPLWYSDGMWRCERAEESVAPLGELAQVKGRT